MENKDEVPVVKKATKVSVKSPAVKTEVFTAAEKYTVNGTPVWFVIGIVLLFSVASAYVTLQIVKRSAVNAAPIVMIDSAGLVLAKSKSLFLSKDGSQKPEEAAKKFIGELDAIISEYTKAGIIVVNSAAVLNRPEGIDITAKVAAKMGVILDSGYNSSKVQ